MGLTLSIPDGVPNLTSNSNRTSAGWISIGASTEDKRARTYALRDWITANTPQDQRFTPLRQKVALYADDMISQIKAGKLDLYESANKMVQYKTQQRHASGTTKSYRSKLFTYFRFMQLKPDEDEYNDAVTKVTAYTETHHAELSEQNITDMLRATTPKYRVFIHILTTGARIGETSRLRVTDLNFDSNPPEITFRLQNTKTKEETKRFLSTEAVQAIKYYLKTRPSESQWLFPGWNRDKQIHRKIPSDKPISHNSAYIIIQRLFDNLDLKERTQINETTSRRAFHPHIFRTWAANFLKDNDYPADWTEHLIGHGIGTQEHYKPSFKKMGAKWLQLIEPKLHFLTPTQYIETQQDTIVQLKSQLNLLQHQVNKLQQTGTDLVNMQFDPFHPERLQNINDAYQAIANEYRQLYEKHPTLQPEALAQLALQQVLDKHQHYKLQPTNTFDFLKTFSKSQNTPNKP